MGLHFTSRGEYSMRTKVFCALALSLALLNCAATVGTTGFVAVPPDAATTCEKHCNTIGLSLSAVAIMANNVGCICERATSAAESGASTAAGMVTLLIQEEERRQQQQQHHH
jgi:hypothetical protein